ncbi:phosphoadenosine phosphosulfate reductase family protein [Burkholderia sp. Ac-20365]|uniref:phosphoadenosine phosphosulfate reductase domain-containing protein n=1 Tax=Burkholderia sp. Ac-20365 TaxID=2703897 RepID=UPI00197BCAFF|nr:phosphoadenosine phosphosulfate reductase family protein [Burkholderia sp. Ac-20365]MBN3760970.1 phosphoadenosine phosphosulfate reductase family protein [Burkholderia sp. Ac-20365]
MHQQTLFDAPVEPESVEPLFDPFAYETYIVFFSGGKDSVACLLHLLDLGIDRSRIELWHHDVDGNGESFMDWAITPDYCRKLADAFRLPYYVSWREGGFLREMLRTDQPTAAVTAETPSGLVVAGGAGPSNTRRKFPQVTASLAQRWCSAALKIDVGAAAIRNQERFIGSRTLVITGERAEESAARARYNVFERDRTHTQSRHVDHWRPVLHWTEEQVWDALRRHGVVAHPAYHLGFSRVSCAHCIFANPDQRATERKLMPLRFDRIASYEVEFGMTIARSKSVHQVADEGTPYDYDEETAAVALGTLYQQPILVDPAAWKLPSGAYRHGGGPL